MIVTLPGEEQQQVRVTISHQTATVAVPGLPFELPVAEAGALYRVELRGGRTNWVPRKKMLTILRCVVLSAPFGTEFRFLTDSRRLQSAFNRNRKSAAACRSTIVELKAELSRCQVSLQWKNPDFLFKNPDFLIKNPDFLLKNVD